MKFAILGYNTINIGDDVQSFITSTLIKVDFIVNRDNCNIVEDFNTGKPVTLTEKVYLIMNGWFMHNSDWETGNDNINFPYKNENLIPIYISTCLSKDVPLLYRDESINHYRQFEPLLVRDLTTFRILQQKGVNVEFYGCLTQLLDIDNVPDNNNHKEKYQDSVIYIDCKTLYENRNKEEKAFYFEHYIKELKYFPSMKKRIDYAADLLSRYKYAKKIYSHRLHAFLPCRAMGLNAEYVGDLNYRVKDLVTVVPDKVKMKNKFLEHIDYRVSQTIG